MLDPITRLRAARFDGPQALYTEAVRLLSERPALPGDLAGLVARLRKVSADARNEFAEQWADAQYTGERPDLEPITAELAVERIEDAADAIEALAGPVPMCAAAKPLVWAQIETAPRGGEWFIARTKKGTARVVHYDDEYDRFPISHDSTIWETPPVEWIPLSSILSAIPLRPEAEVRAEAWAAAIEAAALKMAKGGLYTVWDRSEAIRTLTPPADISAAMDRIKAEEYARGLADGMLRGGADAGADAENRRHAGFVLAKIAALKGGVEPPSTPQLKGGAA